MEHVLEILSRQVTVPIWVLILVFVGGLIFTAVIREIITEMADDRRAREYREWSRDR